MWFHVISDVCHKTTHFKSNRGIKMTQSKNTMSNQKIGQRFKELIKEFDGTQEITAMYLNYCKTTISRYCSGKVPIPDEVIKKLSKKWDIREEYIRGEDDFKTYTEILHNEFSSEHYEYKKILEYLSLLNFKTTLAYWIICPAHKFNELKETFAPYILFDPSLEPDESEPDDVRLCCPIKYQALDKDSVIYELLSSSEIDSLERHSYVSCCIPFNKICSIDVHPRILLKDYFEKVCNLPLLESIDFKDDFCGITNGFLLNYNGLDMGFYSHQRLKRLFHVLNKHVRLCLDLFISGHIS